jgi:transposase
MARRGVKKKDFERLDDATIARVVLLLEQEKPVTKKAACEILNISYNTTRLNRILDEYKDKIEFTKKRKAIMRGKPFTDMELKDMVVSYLSGDSISKLAESMYRSIHVVKRKIKDLHLPERSTTSTYHNPDMMPDEMVADTFEIGELVWSARYNCVVEIKQLWNKTTFHGTNIYGIWIYGKHNEFGFQPAEELGKLNVLKQFTLRDDEFVTTDKSPFNYRID